MELVSEILWFIIALTVIFKRELNQWFTQISRSYTRQFRMRQNRRVNARRNYYRRRNTDTNGRSERVVFDPSLFDEQD